MKARRFLNVVIDRYGDGGSLSRIVNPRKHLFYPSTAQAQQHQIQQQQIAKAKAKAATETEATPGAPSSEETYSGVLRLPTPKLRFNNSTAPSFDFLPFYSGTGGEERILGLDGNGKTVLCDAGTGYIEIMPSLHEPKGRRPVSLCVTHATADPIRRPDMFTDPGHPEALYVMDRRGSSFEALVYPEAKSLYTTIDRRVWQWRKLPPPPVVVDGGIGDGSISVESYALLNGHENASSTTSSTICVSFRISYHSEWPPPKPAQTGGTYCFDTGTGEWAKAGDWKLPLWSGALHVPELGDRLLFGFQKTFLFEESQRFCAVDASGATRMDGSAPALRHSWVDVDAPSRWQLRYYSAVYLGDGRFCIHRTFDIMETDGWGSGQESVDAVVLLTGVEVVPEGSGLLRMIKHKSIRLDTSIHSIL